MDGMPRKSTIELPPLRLGKETFGQRIARLRKERGYTQVQLATKIGITQGLVSAYECGRLRLTADMVVRFAKALRVTTDQLLGTRQSRNNWKRPSVRLVRRLEKIEALARHQQRTLLKTIDIFLKGAQKGT